MLTEKEAWLECARIWTDYPLENGDLVISEEHHSGICHTLRYLKRHGSIDENILENMIEKIDACLGRSVYLFDCDENGRILRINFCLKQAHPK